MQIAIDARMIKTGSMHGIARYVLQLLNQMKRLCPEHRIRILVNAGSPLGHMDWPDHMDLIEIRAPWISFREQWEIPAVLKKMGTELFHAPSFVAPLVCPCRLVMTIHDLNHIVLPHYYTPLHQFYYRFFVRSCMRRSRHILTVSNFSKEEIVRTLGLRPEKIFVTYNGVSENYRRVEDPDQLRYVRELYELPESFILCLANNKPHKNVHQLVKAYCYSDLTIPLVLASPVERSLISTAERYGKKHLIFFSKFIDERHLPAVYSMTNLFVYPSTYEGFGLPPLEALACGAPVVVARSSSLPEVVGSNAIFADPYNYKDIARALVTGINDQDTRSDVAGGGAEHARRYSWERMAQQTLAVYKRCLEPEKALIEGVVS